MCPELSRPTPLQQTGTRVRDTLELRQWYGVIASDERNMAVLAETQSAHRAVGGADN